VARAARKTTTRRTTAKRTSPARTTTTSPATASTSSDTTGAAPAPGSIDLAGGLRSLLDAVETEVREVSTLSEQIDRLVNELNARRDDQTKRLLALDALRSSADDSTLGAFLEKAIRPRKPRVTEVIPERLNQFQ